MGVNDVWGQVTGSNEDDARLVSGGLMIGMVIDRLG